MNICGSEIQSPRGRYLLFNPALEKILNKQLVFRAENMKNTIN